MQQIQGSFCATGSDLYLQLGGIPDYIEIWSLDGAEVDVYRWAKAMAHDIMATEGLLDPNDGGHREDFGFGYGIAPYHGGELLSTSNQTDVTYGGGVFIERDDKDYRQFTVAAAGISGDATTVNIDTWTLDTAGTPSGHFNGDLNGTYTGNGSLIRIIDADNKHTYEAYITDFTGGQGVTANEVTLSQAVPSGAVTFIGGKFGYKPSAIGTVTKAGVMLSDFVSDGNQCSFMALFA